MQSITAIAAFIPVATPVLAGQGDCATSDAAYTFIVKRHGRPSSSSFHWLDAPGALGVHLCWNDSGCECEGEIAVDQDCEVAEVIDCKWGLDSRSRVCWALLSEQEAKRENS